MRKLIKLATISSLSAVMLLGCASNTTEGEESSKQAVETTTEAATNDTTKEDKESASKEATSTETTSTESATQVANITYPYTYVDAAGREVVIEKEPVRVAVSYLPHWETLMMLDVMPIATTSAAHYASTWDAFKGLDLSSVTDLGDSEMNLELLAQLEPDIILQQVADVKNVDVTNVEKISNVVVFGQEVKMDWRYALREIGKVVNKEAKAEEVIAEIDAKIADARTKIQAKNSGETVMLMSLMGEDQYYYAYRPDLYDEETGLGLPTPEGFTTSETYEQFSMESLVEMNPDYLFVNVFDGDEALFEELSNNSVWNSLNAVKNGHVYTLDGSGHAASAMSTVYTIDFIINTLLAE